MTLSDYRIKANVVNASSVIDMLKILRVVTYNFTGETANKRRIGFIAHEINDAIGAEFPVLIFGDKDETYIEDGITYPFYQQVNQDQLVAIVVKSIQELIEIVDNIVDASEFDGSYTSLRNLPTSFPPQPHTHVANDVTAGTFNNARISQGSVKQHESALSIDSAQITGTKTSAYISDFNATVDARMENVIGAAPAALDTLGEIATRMQDDENAVAVLTSMVSEKVDKITGKGLSTEDYTTTEKTKLSGIATAATANAADATLLSRANHTGTQSIATINGLQTELNGKQAAGSYAPTVHGHAIADVTGLQTALDAKQAAGSYATSASLTTLADRVTALETWRAATKIKRAERFTATANASGDVSLTFAMAVSNTAKVQFLVDGVYAATDDPLIVSARALSTTAATLRIYRTKTLVVLGTPVAVISGQVVNITMLEFE